jgi:HAD superfamily hydrolase (TIGR01509 family)
VIELHRLRAVDLVPDEARVTVDEVDAAAEAILEIDLVAAGDGDAVRDDDHAGRLHDLVVATQLATFGEPRRLGSAHRSASTIPEMPSAVIFDCDGVLFDSHRANVAYYDAIRERLGLAPMDTAWQRRCHYLAVSQVFEEMFGSDAERLAAVRAVAREVDYEPFYALMKPAPDLHAVLDRLGRHHRLGMATNRGATVVEVVRRFGLDRWLETAVGLLDVARPKPHPDVIETCLARLGVAPDAAVYVGDAESDLVAARAAGVHFVAVGTDGWSPRSVRTLAELPPVIDALLGKKTVSV